MFPCILCKEWIATVLIALSAFAQQDDIEGKCDGLSSGLSDDLGNEHTEFEAKNYSPKIMLQHASIQSGDSRPVFATRYGASNAHDETLRRHQSVSHKSATTSLPSMHLLHSSENIDDQWEPMGESVGLIDGRRSNMSQDSDITYASDDRRKRHRRHRRHGKAKSERKHSEDASVEEGASAMSSLGQHAAPVLFCLVPLAWLIAMNRAGENSEVEEHADGDYDDYWYARGNAGFMR